MQRPHFEKQSKTSVLFKIKLFNFSSIFSILSRYSSYLNLTLIMNNFVHSQTAFFS